MKKIIMLGLASQVWLTIVAQKISGVDFDAVKSTLDSRKDIYTQLTDRFKMADSTLTEEEVKVIYYGQCFQDKYNPYGTDSKNFDKFKEYFQKSNYEKALPFVLNMLEKDPMDLKMTYYAIICYHYIEDSANKAIMQVRYENLLLSLFRSGDGKTRETAFVVMRISDEYEAMRNMGVENTSQALSGDCDVMTLKKNDYGLERLYFNIAKPFESMSKMFRSKSK